MTTSASTNRPTKSISWNCNVSSFRGSTNNTAVQEEVFDTAELEREFLDSGAYSYADFKSHQQSQQHQDKGGAGGGGTTREKFARAASTPNVFDNSNFNSNSTNHDSSGCFSLDAGELITSEFVMLKYKQASYNSNYDDSAELVVANENSKTEDGEWDVSGTFDYYHDEVSTSTSTSTTPSATPAVNINEQDPPSISMAQHRPMGRRGSGRQVKRTSLKSIVNPLQPVTETSETALSSTKTPSFRLDAFGDDLQAFAAMCNDYEDDDEDDDDDGNASTSTDFSDTDGLINFMASEAEKSKRIADAQRARAVRPVEDSMSSLNVCDGYVPSPPHPVTTVIQTALDDSLSTLGFNDEKVVSNSINDSTSTLYNGSAVWKAKGGTIHPTCQDSISAIDISCVQGVMKDLNTNDESREKAEEEAPLVKQDVQTEGNATDSENVDVQDVFGNVLPKQRWGATNNNPVRNPFRNNTTAKKEKDKIATSADYGGQQQQQQQTKTNKGSGGSRHHQMNETKNLIKRSTRRRCTVDNGGNSSSSSSPPPGGMKQYAEAQSFRGSNVRRNNSIKGGIGSSLTKNLEKRPLRRSCTVDDAKASSFSGSSHRGNSNKGGIGDVLDHRRTSTNSNDTMSTSESDTLRSSAVRGRINNQDKNTPEGSGSEPEYYVKRVSSILYGDM